MAQEARAQVHALAGAAAAAVPAGGGIGGRRGGSGQFAAGAVGCAACRQWSSRRRGLGTLMRHAMGGIARCRSDGSTAAPPLRTQGMRHAPAPRALVAPGGLALRLRAGLAAARAAAVAVAAVAAAAQHDLGLAAHAQVQPGGSVHGHPRYRRSAGRTRPGAPHCAGIAFIGAVQGAVRSSSLPASQAAAAPTFFGIARVVPRRACATSAAAPNARRLRAPALTARACLAALQGGQAGSGGQGWGAQSARVRCSGARRAGTPRYNAGNAEEGGRGSGLTCRQA